MNSHIATILLLEDLVQSKGMGPHITKMNIEMDEDRYEKFLCRSCDKSSSHILVG